MFHRVLYRPDRAIPPAAPRAEPRPHVLVTLRSSSLSISEGDRRGRGDHFIIEIDGFSALRRRIGSDDDERVADTVVWRVCCLGSVSAACRRLDVGRSGRAGFDVAYAFRFGFPHRTTRDRRDAAGMPMRPAIACPREPTRSHERGRRETRELTNTVYYVECPPPTHPRSRAEPDKTFPVRNSISNTHHLRFLHETCDICVGRARRAGRRAVARTAEELQQAQLTSLCNSRLPIAPRDGRIGRPDHAVRLGAVLLPKRLGQLRCERRLFIAELSRAPLVERRK